MNAKNLTAALLLALTTSCSMEAQTNYTLTFPVGPGQDKTMAYLSTWDTVEKADSAVVTDGVVKFTGHVDAPYAAFIVVGGQRGPLVFIEPGDITVSDDGQPSGTPLNEAMQADRRLMADLAANYKKLDLNDSLYARKAEAILAQYDSIPAKSYAANRDNAYGLYMYVQNASEKSLSELQNDINANPMLGRSGQIKGLLNLKTAQAATGPGTRYKDFTVQWGDSVQALSSYIKPGRYTLVDYWASWCGPCVAQLKVLKELYGRFHDKGLDVVGVAVWDKPDDTLAAIKSHELPWPCIVDAQTIPTDLYGIQGIPCIMLIGPDGVIIARDKQGRELIEAVEKAMADYEAPAEVALTPAAPGAPAAPHENADTVAAF